jgi:hypothetical protein
MEGINNFPFVFKKRSFQVFYSVINRIIYESFCKVTTNRSPFFNLKINGPEYILAILLANAASTPSFPKVSDSEPQRRQ